MKNPEENKPQSAVLSLVVMRLFVVGVICTPLVWFLWNDLATKVFKLPELSLFQSFELFLLCDVLFKAVSSRVD